MAELQDWIYILRPNRVEMLTDPSYAEQIHVREHYAYHKHMMAQGLHVQVGRTRNDDADMIAVVIFQAASLSQAEEVMAADPLVKNGVMSGRLYPYWIALERPSAGRQPTEFD
ncbi:MAG: hypothetical protein KIS85_05285 [Anaerolineales bacterium]|nr:hypothetical protein [Anaerolineales bacterium]